MWRRGDMYRNLPVRMSLEFWIILTSLFLLAGGFLYDWWVGLPACMICMTQRIILVFILGLGTVSLRRGLLARSIMVLCILGILLSFWHTYVLMFPEQVTQCMPLDFIMSLGGSMMWEALINKLKHFGRECGEFVSLSTYFFISILVIYYALLLNACRTYLARQKTI